MANEIQRSVEHTGGGYNGWPAALMVLVAIVVTIWLFAGHSPLGALGLVLTILAIAGFYTVQPNTAVVLTLFGRYQSTDREQGLRWVPFWVSRKRLSLRARNVTSEKLKVNDNRGNPIEIAANVVWRVNDTARAVFDVDKYVDFANIQIETGLRGVASKFSYDHAEADQPTLRGSGDHVAEILREELQERVNVAGIVIDDARISHLAYAPEIAGAMLRRQQAQAIIEARKLIVEGAVGMVELDDDRKATMVSNLMVVLCSDHDAQPVLNTGTLYG